MQPGFRPAVNAVKCLSLGDRLVVVVVIVVTSIILCLLGQRDAQTS